MRRSLLRGAAILALFAVTGCGTIANLGYEAEGPSVYGGVGFDLRMLDPSSSCKGMGVVYAVLDFPFSFALDTATFPATLLCEIFGWKRSGPPLPEAGSTAEPAKK